MNPCTIHTSDNLKWVFLSIKFPTYGLILSITISMQHDYWNPLNTHEWHQNTSTLKDIDKIFCIKF